MHTRVQATVNDGEDIEREHDDRELVRQLRHRALGVVHALEEVIQEERDRDTVRRVRRREAVLEVVVPDRYGGIRLSRVLAVRARRVATY